jgi:hypothetical protein
MKMRFQPSSDIECCVRRKSQAHPGRLGATVGVRDPPGAPTHLIPDSRMPELALTSGVSPAAARRAGKRRAQDSNL